MRVFPNLNIGMGALLLTVLFSILFFSCKTPPELTPDTPAPPPGEAEPPDPGTALTDTETLEPPETDSPAAVPEDADPPDLPSKPADTEVTRPEFAPDPQVAVPRRIRRAPLPSRALSQPAIPVPPDPVPEQPEPPETAAADPDAEPPPGPAGLGEDSQADTPPPAETPPVPDQPAAAPSVPEEPSPDGADRVEPPAQPVTPEPPETPDVPGTEEPDEPDVPSVSDPAVPSGDDEDRIDEALAALTAEIDEGNRIAVELPGTGWIFLGAPGVEFIEKVTTPDGESFILLVNEGPGTYRLAFQRQDFSAGTTEEGDVIVDAVPQDETGTELPGGTASVDPEAGDLPETTELTEAEPVTPPGEPVDPQVASPEESGASPLALLDDAVSRDDPEEAEAAAARIIEQGDVADALRFLETYVNSFTGDDEWRAALLMVLARMYETDPEVRNMRKALALYNRVIDDFPLSGYREEAQERGRYINRHFIEIR